MRQFSAAVLDRAFGPLLNLFSPPRGRHSSAAALRRRSTRVRRYATALILALARIGAATGRPALPPAPEPVPVSPASVPVPALARVPNPRPAPAPERPADDLALVRLYYAAHEDASARERFRDLARSADRAREFDRIQAEATARMCGWAHRNVPLSGDLLASDPAPGLPRSAASAPLGAPVRHEALPRTAPAPQVAAPVCEDADDWRTFTRLARVWLAQQDRRPDRAQPRPQLLVQPWVWGGRAGVAA